MSSHEDVVEVRGLRVWTPRTTLLHGVDLTVAAGGITALVGPSGSGKTTTALALLGEAPAGAGISGAVRVAGVDVVDGDGITRQARTIRGRGIAYMPQHPGSALNPVRRVGPTLRELSRLHGADRDAGRTRAASALREAQLPDTREVLRRLPHEFSGGQRQRVALAQVLACGPRALVLDEPSTGLDTVTRLGLVRELAALARGGLAILLLSHDHDMVRALADRVVLLDAGHVTATGPAPRLLPPAAPLPAPRPERAAAATGPAPRADGPAAALSVRALTAWLRTRQRNTVLHDVSLDVPPSGCVALVGPSGSGKTTLARCVAGLHERHGGRLLLDDVPLPVLRHRDRETKRRVQYVWQESRSSFDDHRPVIDQIARTAVRLRDRPPRQAAREAFEVLARLGVDEATVRRHPEGLSGGELQRAAFARAVLAEPRILVCDEITTALDSSATEHVLAEVRRLRDEHGTSVLWIGHDLALTARVADRVAVLDQGRVVEEGPCDAVLSTARAPATRLLLRARTLPRRTAPPERNPPAGEPTADGTTPHREDPCYPHREDPHREDPCYPHHEDPHHEQETHR
ncbi:ABC transporter ATP-binding protein [Streptomyces sp. NPDC058382]|uniref:ABC transporter ATP-binding protein n=1 Tax=unclassified Streptomyces TaxID=2593676 RepID=UPI0036372956